ncbi:MAG: hypothetical protein ACJA01_001425 [Saprospiraceae bacterium]|jgi:uncharacterized protein YyaL (SSP411 family)
MSQVKSIAGANQLIHETSPYLLQHAYNPVDWHPWGPEALEKAKKENKLLIISIGYAACHWCHVMEHESFEDSTVAAIMNEHFVPIKVDREERPDVDDIYMSAANLISGSGGWPLNAFALPDGRPIWAGTYFPKDRWVDILNQFASLKDTEYERLEDSADQLTKGINSLDEIVVSDVSDYYSDDLSRLGKSFLEQIDFKEGGRKGAPKFPMPNNYEFLLKYTELQKDDSAKEAVITTLSKMALGGIYDQVGGGFARYSTDEIWKAPHFEKMTYDNGQLIGLYSQAYRLTKDPLYKRIIEQSLEYVEREMTSEEGGFYSSLDADSDGEEGKFYVWKESEIDNVIKDVSDRALLKSYYSTSTNGNWEHGNNILLISESLKSIAQQHEMSEDDVITKVDAFNKLLLKERENRIRPGLDDKVLTSWNAIMSKGYIESYKALGNENYLINAERNLHFLLENQMQEDYRLNRNYKNGASTINGFLDDYALLMDAMLAMYEVSFDESWLNLSKGFMDYTITHFYDLESRMFFYTSDIDPPLVARKMELADNVIPASNSIMARNLARLGELLNDKSYIEKSDQMLANMWTNITNVDQPSFYSNWLQLLLEKVHPVYEVAIVGPNAIEKAHKMMESYQPNATFLGSLESSDLPLLKYKHVPGTTKIYVCQNKTCKLPVNEVEKALELMK